MESNAGEDDDLKMFLKDSGGHLAEAVAICSIQGISIGHLFFLGHYSNIQRN